jgi:hypothetical protein
MPTTFNLWTLKNSLPDAQSVTLLNFQALVIQGKLVNYSLLPQNFTSGL